MGTNDNDGRTHFDHFTFEEYNDAGVFRWWEFCVNGVAQFRINFQIAGEYGPENEYFMSVEDMARFLCSLAVERGYFVQWLINNEEKQFLDLTDMLPEGEAPRWGPGEQPWEESDG